MKAAILLTGLLCIQLSYCQQLPVKLGEAMKKLEADSQFRHSIISLLVVDGKTGKNIYDKNSDIGLAPASCLKIVTAITAFELLGKEYRYHTNIGYDGSIDSSVLNGNIYIIGSGDPTLGSWRYPATKEQVLLTEFKKAVLLKGIRKINGLVLGVDKIWGTQTTPDGWIWQDIGNYYGAGASGLNWRENQFDLVLKSTGKLNAPVEIIGTNPKFLPALHLINEVTSAQKGTGDNTYIYLAPLSDIGYIRGTIPVNEDSFIVSGALPDAGRLLAATVYKDLSGGKPYPDNTVNYLKNKSKWSGSYKIFYTHTSPPLDSIMFWFLKRSINLYGEAIIKTLGFEKNHAGITDTGVSVIRKFWSEKGIDEAALRMIDGSGLSPANRVTTFSLVTALQFAKQRIWFPSFYYDLPEINNIKMKDGYINGVRSYSGYVNNLHGDQYIFSFIVNNFNGNPSAVREKMWKVLDLLKL
ncbi:MAG: D-alanyl-D-alanine carboxypeptidase/D-alanyl-D-alanine-endopeptidase [Ginsengibacter sp.]